MPDERPDLTLEATSATNIPNEHVIGELIVLRTRCGTAGADYARAIKRVAEKHKLKPGALKRYVAAVDGDKIKEARVELHDLERLLDRADA
jgi:hypothetical protein